jgi:hypothetical protein
VIWPIVLLSLWAVLGAFLVVSPREESEHDRCLKNIGKLEMELFPDLPKELRWAKWPGPESFAYGFQSNFTQIFPQYNLASSGKSHAILGPLDGRSLIRGKDQWHPVGELH